MLTAQQTPSADNPFLQLMQKAAAHAAQHHTKYKPALSPIDSTVLDGLIPIAELQRQGIEIVPWTTDDPAKIHAMLKTGVQALISDRPDLVQAALEEERAASPEAAARLKDFKVQGHRGARGLRPENTLPAFEAGMDNMIDAIETDTGVSTDHVSLIWHDQFYNPQSCRRADGAPYTKANRVFLSDISSHDAQTTFICDKLHFGPDQKNDLALSPVAVAFAKKEGLISPYVPTYVEQVFRFTAFYTDYYRNGPGKSHPQAQERAAEAERVHFNIETKISPDVPAPATATPPKTPPDKNHTVSPQVFVDTLGGIIKRSHMESRADIQSFDFRTLILVEEQFPGIQTVYLTAAPALLSTEAVPPSLRLAPPKP